MIELASTTFDIKVGHTLDQINDAVGKFVDFHSGMIEQGGQMKIVFGQKEANKVRRGATENKVALTKLVQAQKGSKVWKHEDTVLDFIKREYTHKGAAIHLTSSEQLVLFKLLIQGKTVPEVPYSLQTFSVARRRIGDDFLRNVARRANGRYI